MMHSIARQSVSAASRTIRSSSQRQQKRGFLNWLTNYPDKVCQQEWKLNQPLVPNNTDEKGVQFVQYHKLLKAIMFTNMEYYFVLKYKVYRFYSHSIFLHANFPGSLKGYGN